FSWVLTHAIASGFNNNAGKISFGNPVTFEIKRKIDFL
ncbi:unnamed protein product, partial [marine sediment metagenome]